MRIDWTRNGLGDRINRLARDMVINGYLTEEQLLNYTRERVAGMEDDFDKHIGEIVKREVF